MSCTICWSLLKNRTQTATATPVMIPLHLRGPHHHHPRFAHPGLWGLPDGLSFNLDDEGKVVYAPATEEYKGIPKYANKLYSEGLLDPEFSTQTAQQWQAKVTSGQCGVYSGSPTALDPSTTAQQLSLPPLTSATNDEKGRQAAILSVSGPCVHHRQMLRPCGSHPSAGYVLCNRGEMLWKASAAPLCLLAMRGTLAVYG